MTSAPFRVLLVCTGNICRSPITEQLLRARAAVDGVHFSSAGTGAAHGAEMPEEAGMMSRRYGGEPAGHRARRLDRSMVSDAGLILTAAREHRAAVVELFPRASAYTFTLRQFARLLAAVPDTDRDAVSTGEDLVAAVGLGRGYSRPDRPEDDDVPDPYRRSLKRYEEAAGLIDESVRSIAPALSSLR